MKHLLLILLSLLLTTNLAFAQSRMNAYGHFSDTRTRPQTIARTTDPALDSLELIGSSVFRTLNGYLTIDGQYENAPAQIRIYSPAGELKYQREYRQVVNLKFSPNGRFVAFHDMTEIQGFNTICLTSKSAVGSNVFAVDNAFNLAYYDEDQSSVHWKEHNIFAPEPIYKVLIRENEPLFVGYKNVWKIGTSSLESVFEASEGRIFDAFVDSLDLFVSTKVEHPCKFTFTEYISHDLIQFQTQTSSDYPLAHCLETVTSSSTAKVTTAEAIRNPLHFYQNNIAQPVGNSYNEIQEYTQGSPYPHPGVDLLGIPNDTVYSVKNGVVKAILTTNAEIHWRVAISNNNIAGRSQGYLYAHVEELTIPYTVGDVVTEGDALGFLVEWPILSFTHCHFARISDQGATWSGNWWTLDNPLKSITNITDNVAPSFELTLGNDKFAFRNQAGNYLSPNALLGDVRVIAKFHDNINTQDWNVDVDQIRYSLSPFSNPTLMLIDTLAHEFNHWNDTYFAGSYSLEILDALYSRDVSCYSEGNYDFRNFYHIVTNSDGNDTITGADTQQFLRTADFPNGDYIFRVTAIDPFGLSTTDSMVVTFANPFTGISAELDPEGVFVYPNPSASGRFFAHADRSLNFEVCNGLGQVIQKGRISRETTEIDLSGVTAGMYWLRGTDGSRLIARPLVVLGR
jgi:hypothetical protein